MSFNSDLYLKAAHEASDVGRQILLKYFGTELREVEEKFEAGLVSEADRESEKAIREILTRADPSIGILGEELGLSSGKSKDTYWVIDPLDGTNNFVHGIPAFSISIGLMFEGQVKVGVIDVPVSKDRFQGVLGQGATLNKSPISVSHKFSLSESLLVTGFSPRKGESQKKEFEIFKEMLNATLGIRRFGSAALDLCMVAQGRFDGFWEMHLSPWDTAAGALIVQEAGGIVTDFEGSDYDCHKPSILAASPKVHDKMLGLIQRALSSKN